jgi:DNA processing protein
VNEAAYWLGFSLAPDIGVKRFTVLLNAFGSASEAWGASEKALQEAGLEGATLARFTQFRAKCELAVAYAKVEQFGAVLLTMQDEGYPSLLKEVPFPPMVLYVRGTLIEQDSLALAIVGTRKASPYGRDAAQYFAKHLAQNGVTVISGLAHGIDAAAHRAALENNGRTIAVLGCGIDQVYPRDHSGLASDICKHGAVISEFPVGTRPDAHNFPRRNRIISGLSLGVLVVEAPESSGALITATTAAEQGRDVFAVPGNIFNPASTGNHRLIQDGAKLVIKVDDILSELNIAQRDFQVKTTTEKIAPANETESSILSLLSTEPIHVDDLARQANMPIMIISSTLTLLELKGLARMVGHMQYTLGVD